MSALVVTSGGEFVCHWQEDVPREGDVLWFAEANKLLLVTTVVRCVAVDAPSSSAYPVSGIKIIVDDLSIEEDGTEPLLNILNSLKQQGL